MPPISYKSGKKEVKEYIKSKLPATAKILDVGPGIGTYHELLKEDFQNMDACEIYAPYIEKYDLKKKYGTVYNQSVTDFQNFQNYDLVIMGDILEHLTVQQAQQVVNSVPGAMMIAVPFEHEQGAYHGIESERHLQPDLTPEVFSQRYPGFETVHLAKRNKRGSAKHGCEYMYGYYWRGPKAA